MTAEPLDFCKSKNSKRFYHSSYQQQQQQQQQLQQADHYNHHHHHHNHQHHQHHNQDNYYRQSPFDFPDHHLSQFARSQFARQSSLRPLKTLDLDFKFDINTF